MATNNAKNDVCAFLTGRRADRIVLKVKSTRNVCAYQFLCAFDRKINALLISLA